MKGADATRAELIRAHESLRRWLLDEAYPRWASQGVEGASGGFVESIESDGRVMPRPRRLRVQARQIFAFAHAAPLGWPEDARPLIRGGLDYLTTRYQRADGLFRTLVDAGGRALDERALLYDQAFVLLAYAAAAAALGECAEFERRALTLRGNIERHLRAPDGAFFSDAGHPSDPRLALVRESNPHMHLLEACLAWAQIGADAGWHAWAGDIIELSLRRMRRDDSGWIGESHTSEWLPAPGLEGRILEPGHQFEWAWLLLRAARRHGRTLEEPALRLIAGAERFGVLNGVAVNALLDDLSPHDAGARLWPQTERLKAALMAAEVAGGRCHADAACAAAGSILFYFNVQTPGLWFDSRAADGRVLPSCAPASTLYHLVGAITELHRTLRKDAPS